MTTLEVLKERLSFLECIDDSKGASLHIDNSDIYGEVFFLPNEGWVDPPEQERYNQICQDAFVKMINTLKFNLRAEIHTIETEL